MSEKIKVLVVDDSSLVRKIIGDILESDPDITVVGTANNGRTAVFKSKELNPDVITMDIEMPIMDGLAALKEIIASNPKPVIMLSVLTHHGADATFKALELGAVDFVPKPSSLLSLSVDEIGELLKLKVKSVYKSKISAASDPGYAGLVSNILSEKQAEGELWRFRKNDVSKKLVAIGTSTGGPSALLQIFRTFPENFPAPVVVVQHMPEGFTKAFSERLNLSSTLSVKEAEDGDRVLPGCGYIAPGHSHMLVEKRSEGSFLRVVKGEKVSGHRPSIDVLFHSVAECYSSNTVAVIMTGMGRDGADGMSHINSTGGFTLAQDEATSVVYGMNRVAVESGAVKEIIPLHEITKKIVEHI